ncbi:BglG family transcription antiterminator [Enterococcus hulanensis]|uniref:BglG family transcription antiterminator n=1 Tax=Enterococcus hulanensis TaxID=2559929 RepID=A0ABU3ETU5_9ENTE|nr:BglG family transcription antiterminator [Enterococcus hulanensis]MDT2598288.1 BglG family transcription antiterminator [Enterococcus hulanensis]MDT2608207.1 BglG family transcription antiterminator [Enterococcus hulanensis]MDT2615502.1 BglG family transcription antiterminator [Enterococcus hulanensis]MDT2626527.1 BglG family transcription antiterminator [Enterococcus hulanensis]MDT2654574.1 BglG family transcription antiterminator [Enterococcus hulanensis]
MQKIDQRTRQVLIKLIEKPVISQKNLANQLKLSKVQIDYVITKVNESLSDEGLPPVWFDGNYFHLADTSRLFLVDFFSSDKVYRYYEMDIGERKKYIYLMLFYHCGEYLSVNHFLEVLEVGKTTFINDLKKVEKELEALAIKIKYDRRNGYYLSGDEAVLRYHLMKLVLEDLRSDNGSFLWDYFLFNESAIEKEQMFQQIAAELEHYSIVLVENRLLEFSYMLIFLLPRLNKEWTEFYDRYSFQTFYQTKEYAFSQSLLEKFSVENKYAALYICGWMLGMAIGNADERTPDYSIINELVERIFDRFEQLSGIRFKEKSVVRKQLYSHFRPAYYRLFFHLPIINPLNEKIIQEYPDLFQIVKETMKPIENLFGTLIPDEEISFLTIHFASLINDNDEYQVKRKVGIIVCPNGIGSSAIIYNELKNLFPEMIFIGPIETNEIYQKKQDYDMIFTTVPNMRLFSLKKPVYTVNPIMSIDEKYNLVQEVQNGTRNLSNDYQFEELLSIIGKHAKISDETGLRKELTKHLRQPNVSNTKGRPANKEEKTDLSLSDILSPDFIQLNLSTNSWEEAFYVAATPLIDAEIVSRRYIDKIIQTTYEEGPYMVISHHVALPHARPEDGAKKVGLGITVLDKPIKILGQTPMKYIFTLAAVDNKRHLTALAELVSLIDQPDFFQMLDQTNSPEEAFQWILDFI